MTCVAAAASSIRFARTDVTGSGSTALLHFIHILNSSPRAQSEVLAAFLDDLGARMRDAKSLAAAQCKSLRLDEKVCCSDLALH